MDPWFGAYTFIPADGIFFGPFCWGYYSPWMVYRAPFFGYFGRYYRHFGPGYRPPLMVRRNPGFAGRSHTVPGISGFDRGGGFAGPRESFGRSGASMAAEVEDAGSNQRPMAASIFSTTATVS